MDPKLSFHAIVRRAGRRTSQPADAARGAARLHRQSAGRRPGWRRAAVDLDADAGVRQRIACRLHDDLGPLLALQGLKLASLCQVVDAPVVPLVRDLQDLLDRLSGAMRAAVLELADPRWPAMLEPALREVAAAVMSQTGLTIVADTHLAGLVLPAGHVATLCRVVRELCLNAHRHGRARQVQLRARLRGREVCVCVGDDGVGMTRDPQSHALSPQGGFGLVSAQAQVRALGGRLQIRSQPGGGTRVSLSLPRPSGR